MLPIVIYIISAILPFLLIPSRLQDLLPVTFLLPSPLAHRYALLSSSVSPTPAIRDIATIPVATDILTPCVSSFAVKHLSVINPQEAQSIGTNKTFASLLDILLFWKVDLEIPVALVLVAVLVGFGAWKLWTTSTTENGDRSFITLHFEQPPPAACSEDFLDVDDEDNSSVKAEFGSPSSSDDEKSMDLTTPFSAYGRPSICLTMDGHSATTGEPTTPIPNPRQAGHLEADGSLRVMTPIHSELNLAITHAFSVTTIPKTISAEDFFTLRELESQHVVLRGRGLLKYRVIQSRLRCHAHRMELENARAASASRKQRQSLSPTPPLRY